MKIEYYEDMLEQEAINKYLNMIANDYNGELAKIFKEKYINKDKEIERLENENERYRIAINEMAFNISKTIEYIEEHELNGNKISEMLCGSEIVELLEILKGSDKE